MTCDFAETYHIYNWRELPLRTAALFAVGLRENSRIKMRMSGQKFMAEEILLARIADTLSYLYWVMAQSGKKAYRPQSILEKMLAEPKESDAMIFDSGDDFDKAWERMRKKVKA